MAPEVETTIREEARDLWDRMRQGDEEALGQLFLGHYALLYNYGFRLTQEGELVKDGIQEVFAYIWEKRSKLSAVESVKAYLLVSLRRQLLKYLKKQQQRQASHHELEIDYAVTAFSPEDLLVMQESEAAEKQALYLAFQEIPPRQREALYLKTYDGLSYREIAAIMNVSPQVARNYVSEAFHRLRELFVPHT